MIKFGCCSFNFVGLDLEQSLRTIRGMGIHYADIGVMGADAQVDQLQAAAQPEAVGAKLNEVAQEIEIECVGNRGHRFRLNVTEIRRMG